MHIFGIVAEYNPFHNGHKYLVEQTRKNGATHIVAVMSGAVVQRGDAAVLDKYFRAKKAIENGVDLVLELPCPYSCSSGEIFARSAVKILASLGENVVNGLSFGCETDNVDIIKSAALASFELKDSSSVREKLSSGMNYPKAVFESACEIYGDEVGQVLSNPNSILAVEYAKAIEEFAPNIKISPVMRKSVSHHDDKISGEFASATKVREMIKNGENPKSVLPQGPDIKDVYFIENMQKELLFRLACADKEILMQIPDVNEDVADRIILVMKKMPATLDEFFVLCKTKNIIMARLRRIVIYLALGVKKEDIKTPPYARILAFNGNGQEVLSKCKNSAIPIDTSLRRLENTSSHAKRISQLEQNAVKFQYFCGGRTNTFVNDYQRKIVRM